MVHRARTCMCLSVVLTSEQECPKAGTSLYGSAKGKAHYSGRQYLTSCTAWFKLWPRALWLSTNKDSRAEDKHVEMWRRRARKKAEKKARDVHFVTSSLRGDAENLFLPFPFCKEKLQKSVKATKIRGQKSERVPGKVHFRGRKQPNEKDMYLPKQEKIVNMWSQESCFEWISLTTNASSMEWIIVKPHSFPACVYPKRDEIQSCPDLFAVRRIVYRAGDALISDRERPYLSNLLNLHE